jgi:predicted nucleic acid-binding protein
MPRTPLLLDACVAINLAATDHIQPITGAIGVTFILVRQAAAEVGHLRDFAGGEPILTPINLSQYTSDTLEITDLTPPEYPVYLDLARAVDDGEAATIAVAAHRNLQLATDDRKARRLCAERHIPEPLRTLALMHAYTNAAGLKHSQLRDLLIKIRDRANFQPSRGDPDHKWWDDHIDNP